MSYLSLISVTFGMASSILLIRGHLCKGKKTLENEAATFYGANPYIFKGKLSDQKDILFGFCYLLISFVLQLTSVVFSKEMGERILLGNKMEIIGVAIVFIVCLTSIAIILPGWITRREMRDWYLSEDVRQGILNKYKAVKTGGLYQQDIDNGKTLNDISPNDRKARIDNAKTGILRAAEICDIRKKWFEAEDNFIQRVASFIENKNNNSGGVTGGVKG